MIISLVELVEGAEVGRHGLLEPGEGLHAVQPRDGGVVGVQVVQEAAVADADDVEDHALVGLGIEGG